MTRRSNVQGLALVGQKPVRKHAQTYQLPAPWEAAVEGWLNWLRMGGIAKSTIYCRRGHIRYIARRSNTEHPREVTLAILVEVCSEKPWSNDHRKGVRTSLVGFFEWCVAQGITQANPAAPLPHVKESQPKPRPATDSIWFALLDKATPRERIMALLAGEAGMRRAEVAVAHSDDLIEDLDGWAIIVHGKGGKQRVVPLTDSLAKEIRDYCREAGYLFPGIDRWGNSISDHVSVANVGIIISRLMPPTWTMHKLRHRFATRGHGGTGNLRAVQEALGHVSVATTQKYVATSRAEIRAVSEAAHKSRP